MKVPTVSKILTANGEVNFAQMNQKQIEVHLKLYPQHAQYFKDEPKKEDPKK